MQIMHCGSFLSGRLPAVEKNGRNITGDMICLQVRYLIAGGKNICCIV